MEMKPTGKEFSDNNPYSEIGDSGTSSGEKQKEKKTGTPRVIPWLVVGVCFFVLLILGVLVFLEGRRNFELLREEIKGLKLRVSSDKEGVHLKLTEHGNLRENIVAELQEQIKGLNVKLKESESHSKSEISVLKANIVGLQDEIKELNVKLQDSKNHSKSEIDILSKSVDQKLEIISLDVSNVREDNLEMNNKTVTYLQVDLKQLDENLQGMINHVNGMQNNLRNETENTLEMISLALLELQDEVKMLTNETLKDIENTTDSRFAEISNMLNSSVIAQEAKLQFLKADILTQQTEILRQTEAVNALKAKTTGSAVTIQKTGCKWTGYLNGWDAVLNWRAPGNYVMVGLYSYHYNGTEDRRWKIYYCALKAVFAKRK